MQNRLCEILSQKSPNNYTNNEYKEILENIRKEFFDKINKKIDMNVLKNIQFYKKYNDPTYEKFIIFFKNKNYFVDNNTKEYFDILEQSYLGAKELYEDSNLFLKNMGENDPYVEAIRGYSGSDYKSYQMLLENEKANIPEYQNIKNIKKNIKLIQEFLLRKDLPRLKRNLIVYRAINITDPKLLNDYEQLSKNTVIENKTFMSTSLNRQANSDYKKTTITWQIHIPAGTPLLHLDSTIKDGNRLSGSPWAEEEILLPSGLPLEYHCFYEMEDIYTSGKVFVFGCPSCLDMKLYTMNHIPSLFNNIEDKSKFSNNPEQHYDNKFDVNSRIYNKVFSWYYNGLITSKEKNSIRIMSWNVHEWGDNIFTNILTNNKTDMEKIICEINPDILGVQENNKNNRTDIIRDSVSKVIKTNTNNNNHPCNMKHIVGCDADPGNSGSVLVNSIYCSDNRFKILKTGTFDLQLDENNNYVRINKNRCGAYTLFEDVTGVKFAIIVVHFEVYDDEKRIINTNALLKYINENVKKETNNIFILGDFNSYMKEDYDEENLMRLEAKKLHYPKIFAAIDMLKSVGYEDLAKKVYGENYRKHIPINTNQYGGRIDFIFVNKENELLKNVKMYTYYNDLSDHIPIIFDIFPTTTQQIHGSNLRQKLEKERERNNIDVKKQKEMYEYILKYM
jgi:endonuclease/exonuclease/phosphatase family metal-dependent hydrolase